MIKDILHNPRIFFPISLIAWPIYFLVRIIIAAILLTLLTVFLAILLPLEITNQILLVFSYKGLQKALTRTKTWIITTLFIPASEGLHGTRQLLQEDLFGARVKITHNEAETQVEVQDQEQRISLQQVDELRQSGTIETQKYVIENPGGHEVDELRFVLGGNSLYVHDFEVLNAIYEGKTKHVFYMKHVDASEHVNLDKSYIAHVVDRMCAYIHGKKQLYPNKKVVLYGHSMGAAILAQVYLKLRQNQILTDNDALILDRSFTDFSAALYATCQHIIPMFLCKAITHYLEMRLETEQNLQKGVPKAPVYQRSVAWDYLLGVSAPMNGETTILADRDHSDYNSPLFGSIEERWQEPVTDVSEREEKAHSQLGNRAPYNLIQLFDCLLIFSLLYFLNPIHLSGFLATYVQAVYWTVSSILFEKIALYNIQFFGQLQLGQADIDMSQYTQLKAFQARLSRYTLLCIMIICPGALAAWYYLPAVFIFKLRIALYSIPVLSNTIAFLTPQCEADSIDQPWSGTQQKICAPLEG